jgi:hypothetical protein
MTFVLGNNSHYLSVGEYLVYDSLEALDTGAYSEGLGKVVVDGNEDVLVPLELKDLAGIEYATKKSPLSFMGDGSLTMGYGNPWYEVYKDNETGYYIVERVK